MLDQEIVEVVLLCVEKVMLSDSGYLLTCDNPNEDNERFCVQWCEEKNKWLLPNLVDPLSCVIVSKNLERTKDGHDHLALATICRFFNRRYAWVKSFQDAWFNESNRSASISGYIIGQQVKKQLKQELGYWKNNG